MTTPLDDELEFYRMLAYLLDLWAGEYFVGAELCECGMLHTIHSPVERVIKECDCGIILDIMLEEAHD